MDKIIECSACQSKVCYYYENEHGEWMKSCIGCGFYTNNKMNIGLKNFNIDEFEFKLPELYKVIKKVDNKGYVWYPFIINDDTKGIIFVDGTSLDNWEWSSIKVIYDENEKKFKSDPKTKQNFGKDGFIAALRSIDYIN